MSDKDFDYDLYELDYGIKFDEELEVLEPAPKPPEKKNEKPDESQARLELYDWLQCIVSAVLCGILIFIFIGNFVGVDGSSMLNTLHDKDIVVMSNLFYTPQYGDIVIIDTDEFDKPLVKRVIATEGQTIDIDFETGDVMIDGKVIIEDYIRELTTTGEGFTGPETVPDGCVFVMGDNRNASMDSRDERIGMIDTRNILGKVLFLIIPGKDDSSSREWDRFGSVYG